jgi:hypothetical protein
VHSEERAISLSLKMCPSNQGSLAISIQVRNSVRPMHLFGHNVDHDYYFELLREEERDTQSITRCSTSHHRLFRAFPRVNQGMLPAKFHENNSESRQNGRGFGAARLISQWRS